MKLNSIYLFLLICILFSGCSGCYKLNGASEGSAKTVSVEYFQNNAALTKPTYASTLTEALKDLLTSQSRLTLVKRSADIQFEGQITRYDVTPQAIQSGTDQAALNRLTITVHVKCTNNTPENEKDGKLNFDQDFTFYADYPSSKSLPDVEDALIKTINDQMTMAIFNAALSKW
ncbi:MAG: LptE family protein [Bacteroidia bacterium]